VCAVSCNGFIDTEKRRIVAKDRRQGVRLDEILYTLCESLRITAILISPVMPKAAHRILSESGQVGLIFHRVIPFFCIRSLTEEKRGAFQKTVKTLTRMIGTKSRHAFEASRLFASCCCLGGQQEKVYLSPKEAFPTT
jgi:hypothetical protein